METDLNHSIGQNLEELGSHQEFLNSVIENIPNMIFVKDAKDLRFIRFNRAGEELLGYSRKDLLGKNDYDFFPKEQADHFTAFDRTVLESKTLVDIPFEKLKTRLYGERILHTRKIPILDKNGEPQFLLGISEDITEKKRAEEQYLRLQIEKIARDEAEKSARRERFLSKASAILSSSLDYEKTLSNLSDLAVLNLADWCSIDMVEKSGEIRTLVVTHRDPEKVKSAYEHKEQTAVNLNALGGVARVIRSGVSELDQLKSVMIVPIKTTSRVMGCISFVSEESGHVFGEVDLSLAEELARRAALAIENSELYTSAREANKAKTDFLANMSHEIRTPLGAVLGFAELMLGSGPLSGKIDYMMAIRKNGDLLLHLIDDLLDLSKVEAGHMKIEKGEFSLIDLMEDIESFSKIRAKEKGIDFELKILSFIPEIISSDANRLRQILLNIIGNAVKFTSHGSVRVEMKFEILSGSLGHLKFFIKDTGVGISAEQAKRLFQPFVQADTSTTRKFGGTGLGLALSQKLARALKGDVTLISSQLGSGSLFAIDVEVEVITGVALLSDQRNHSIENVSGPSRRQLKGAKILLVEDSPDNQVLVSKYLETAGADVDVAKNGLEGVLRATSGLYNVILMDIQMPVLDGYGAVQRLRASGSKVPIVALTAHALEADRKRCFELGCNQYLTKPVNRTLLLETVSQLAFGS